MEEKRNFRLTKGFGCANVAQRMTETLTPPKIFSPLDKRCHLPVEQTQDQRRTTFFWAVGNEAGNSRREPRIPVVHGGEYVKNKDELFELLKENLSIWVEKDYLKGGFNGPNLQIKITFDCKTVTEDHIPLSELQD